MDLFATPGNPIPPDPIVSAVRTRDGLTLRVARWVVPQSRGTVTIAIGRSEFIEEYFEIVQALLDRRFDCVIMDWRGQGQSGREIKQGRRGHVSSFSGYRRDLEALENQIIVPFAKRPWFAFGHSMGAAILIDQAHDGRSPFERMILSAPMVDIKVKHPKIVKMIVKALDLVGFGRRMIPFGSEAPIFARQYEDNILTTDERQYRRLATTITRLPALAVGAPTIRWLAEAFRLTARFASPRYAVETLTPILIVAAGADRIVETAATERFAIRLKAGRCLTIPGSRHQLIMERNEVIQQFWAAFDAFIPGERVPPVRDARTKGEAPKTAEAALARIPGT